MPAVLAVVIAVCSLWIGGILAAFATAAWHDGERGATAAGLFFATLIPAVGLVIAARLIGA